MDTGNEDESMDEKKDFVMVTVSGPDQPGITAAFSKILVDNHVEIVDIEQASLQDFLGLSFLIHPLIPLPKIKICSRPFYPAI